MKRFVVLGLLLLGMIACSRVAMKGLTAEEVGLSPADVFDDPAPPAWEGVATDPGDNGPVERAFEGAPPAIPHAIGDYLPITREENLCVMCHSDPDMAPAMSEGHYVDLRNAPGEVRDSIAGARQVCISCHVEQTNAPPLQENHF